ncbi:MAG: hypothetical protein ACR2HR_16770 [Euzebya sp.]
MGTERGVNEQGGQVDGPPQVLIVGRYRGVLQVLAQMLGPTLRAEVVSLDEEGSQQLGRVVARAAATDRTVIVTTSPGDPSIDLVLARIAPARIIAVVWHPPDQRPALPAQVRIVAAGRIADTLAAAVRHSRA